MAFSARSILSALKELESLEAFRRGLLAEDGVLLGSLKML